MSKNKKKATIAPIAIAKSKSIAGATRKIKTKTKDLSPYEIGLILAKNGILVDGENKKILSDDKKHPGIKLLGLIDCLKHRDSYSVLTPEQSKVYLKELKKKAKRGGV